MILRQRLVLEAMGCKNLDDINVAYDFLVETAKSIGATLYSQPIVMKTPGQGLTGIAILLESAEVLHQWPELDFMDFYLESCKEFNLTQVYTVLEKFFSPQKVKVQLYHKLRD